MIFLNLPAKIAGNKKSRVYPHDTDHTMNLRSSYPHDVSHISKCPNCHGYLLVVVRPPCYTSSIKLNKFRKKKG